MAGTQLESETEGWMRRAGLADGGVEGIDGGGR
jgi:hypothetical protein